MFIWFFVAIFIYGICVGLFHIYIRRISSQQNNFHVHCPPVILEPWFCPFLGPFLSLFDLQSAVKKWTEKYGSNFTLFILGKSYTFITKYEDVKRYYHAREEVLSMSQAAHRLLGSAYPESQYLVEYSVVPYLHRLFTSENLSQMLRNTSKVIEDYFNHENGRFWSENGKDEVVVDLFEFMHRLIVRMNSINFISSQLYQTHPEELIDLFTTLYVDKSFLSAMTEGIQKRLGMKTKKEIAWQRWMHLLQPEIDRCLNMLENNQLPNEFDIVYENVKYSKEELKKRGEEFTPRLVSYYAYTSIVPAQLNTYTTASYLVLEWIRHQHDEIGEQIREEIDRTRTENERTIESLNSMDYLQSCLYEIIRMRTDFLLSIRHASQIVPLSSDRFIPEGNFVITPMTGAPDLYLHPEKFDPSRHFKPREEMKADPYRALPFGRGKHPCAGERYLKIQMKILLIRLTEFCQLELMEQSRDFEETINRKQFTGLSRPTKPVFVKISRKLS